MGDDGKCWLTIVGSAGGIMKGGGVCGTAESFKLLAGGLSFSRKCSEKAREALPCLELLTGMI